MTPILTVRNLTRHYQDKAALKDVSFNLFKGEIVGLLGLNGAGKSTALSLLSGKLLPDHGEIMFEGQDILKIQSRPNQLGFVPEGAPLFEDLTVLQQLKTLAGLYGLSPQAGRTAIETAIADFELSSVRHKRISALSKGYKRRVALAGAFLSAPRLLLMDEPTDGLDPIQKSRMLQLLRRTSAERTMLISTHSLTDVAELCDRIIILSQGRLVFDGTRQNLSARGQNGDIESAFEALVREGES